MDIDTNPGPDQPALRILRSLFPKLSTELNLFQLVAMGQLHRDLFNHPSEFLCTSLRTFLKSGWLDDPIAFRSRMREWGVVISGSSALSFIDPDNGWAPNDLDLYVPSQHASALLDYLKGVEGYVSRGNITPEEEQYENLAPGTGSNIQSVTKLRKLRLDEELRTRVEQLEAKISGATKHDVQYYTDLGDLEAIREERTASIDVVVSKTQISLDPIFVFHSTVVMNFISADEVVSLYPSFTKARQSIIQNDRGGDKMDYALSKYAGRGFTTFKSRLHLLRGQKCGALCPSIPSRRTNDRRCLRVPISREPGYSSSSPRYWKESDWRFEDKLSITPPCWNQWCPNNLFSTLDEQVLTSPSVDLPVATYRRMCRFIHGGLEAMRLERFLREASYIVYLAEKEAEEIAKSTNSVFYYTYAVEKQIPLRRMDILMKDTVEKRLERYQKSLDSQMLKYEDRVARLRLRVKAFVDAVDITDDIGDATYEWDDHLKTANRVRDVAASLQTALLTISSDAIPGILDNGFGALDEVYKRQLYGFKIINRIRKELLDAHVKHWILRCRFNRLSNLKEQDPGNFQYEEQLAEDDQQFPQAKDNLEGLKAAMESLNALVWRPDYEVKAPCHEATRLSDTDESLFPGGIPSNSGILLRISELLVPVHREESVDSL